MTLCVSENPGDGGQAGAAEAPAEGARGKGRWTRSVETTFIFKTQAYCSLVHPRNPRLPQADAGATASGIHFSVWMRVGSNPFRKAEKVNHIKKM